MSSPPSHFVGGKWIDGGGTEFTSTNPATSEPVWHGRAADDSDVARATTAATKALDDWSTTPLNQRINLLHALVQSYRDSKNDLAQSISRETGKPHWEALTEVDSMIAKIPISIEAQEQRCRDQSRDISGATGITRFRPHGVMAILGPFNMPGHLPNGHLVPALLAGNTIIFKPSEKTPLVGQHLIQCCESAGFPPGVVNLLQGGPPVATSLVHDNRVNGILFTGSTAAGQAIHRLLAGDTTKILALEMGGNNPLIVHESQDLNAAALTIIQSAFITAGQRCSCARRLILCRGPQSDTLLQNLIASIQKLRIGFPTDQPEPFMGTVISPQAADSLLAAQRQLISLGGKPLVEMKRGPRSAALLTPGLIDVTAAANRPDVEYFGPWLQLIFVDDFDAAVAEANRTSFGLSAGLLSDNRDVYDRFSSRIRAGVIHWNRPLTGASGSLPFGGIGASGNHRPGGYLAADYAAYPVARLESPKIQLQNKLPPGMMG